MTDLDDVAAPDEQTGPARLRRLLTTAIASMLRAGLNHSDVARLQCLTASKKYRERWAQGDLEGLLPVLSDLLAWLREAGIDVANNADVVALFTDPSFRGLRSRVPAIDCDPQLRNLFRRLGVESGARRR